MKYQCLSIVTCSLFLLLLATTSVTAQEPDMPMGQDSAETAQSLLPEDDPLTAEDNELFGTRGGGYVHPFLSISGEYTDNLFNVYQNEKDNFLTTISPGIWLAVPRTKEVPLSIAPNNTTAGGLQMSLPEYHGFERYNAYIMGALDFKYYSQDSELNDYDANVEGFFKLNLRSGISLEFIDHFTRSQDRFDIGNATAKRLRRFHSNIFLTDLNWDFSEKFSLKIEYSNFFLDYKETIDNFLNRDDNAISLYGFYKYSPKTSFFLEYRYIDVSYDTARLKENNQDYLYGGINWASSEKTYMRLKAGYQAKNYNNDEIAEDVDESFHEDNDSFALEFEIQYQITEKTRTSLTIHHQIEETDSFGSLDKQVLGGVFRYNQAFSDKFIGMLDLVYENADYNQFIGLDRDEDRYSVRPALQYIFKEWLMAEISYEYEKRNSTNDLFDYSTNTISFSLNSAL